ncbi:MAG: helix-turn-helix domain-containing protein [Salinivirgaceae bacterium]|nr:helix-turn-helix domain-containing protein [Salinivirgaceae bacterium]
MIENNIKFLRKKNGLTQEDLAKKIGVNRAMIGSYEEKRAQPKISVLQGLSTFFKVSIDDLINTDLANYSNESPYENRNTGQNLRVLTAAIDEDNNELISLVPAKASAGYTAGYADVDYIEKLPGFNLPFNEISRSKSYRVFQIKGDSMEPIKSGSYIICEYLLNWNDIDEGKPYVVLTKYDGIIYKRLFKHSQTELLLKSDNPEYEPYNLNMNDVLEVWKALGYISFSLPDANLVSINHMQKLYIELKDEIEKIKKL